MYQKLLIFFCIIFSNSLYAEIKNELVGKFIQTYLGALKQNNTKLLRKLSTSNNICKHSFVINSVGNEKYTYDIKQFLKDGNDIKFAKFLSDGNPVIIGNPTHIVDVNWSFTKENYKSGHKCHAIVGNSVVMTLAISNRNGIIEHSNCPSNKQIVITKNVKPTKTQTKEIKNYLLEQKHFSRLSSRKFIMENYGYNSAESKSVLKQVCDKL